MLGICKPIRSVRELLAPLLGVLLETHPYIWPPSGANTYGAMKIRAQQPRAEEWEAAVWVAFLLLALLAF